MSKAFGEDLNKSMCRRTSSSETKHVCFSNSRAILFLEYCNFFEKYSAVLYKCRNCKFLTHCQNSEGHEQKDWGLGAGIADRCELQLLHPRMTYKTTHTHTQGQALKHWGIRVFFWFDKVA